MVDLTHLTDADLRRQFGSPTVERGLEYVRRRRVTELSVRTDSAGDLLADAVVQGSQPRPYVVRVQGWAEEDGWLDNYCTCPLVGDCKHVVAVLVTLRDDIGVEETTGWETTLDGLLDELEAPAREGPTRLLGLSVDLNRPVVRGYRERVAPKASHGELRIRPVRPGARGGWVKSGVSWHGLRSLALDGYDPAQVAALEELLTGYRAASRMTYYGAEEHLQLRGCGPGFWPQLRRAVEAGVAVVAGKGLSAVSLALDPVSLELDANSRDDGWLRLVAGVQHDTEWYSADDLELLGDPGHGVALFQAGDRDPAVVLAALRRPAGPRARKLLESAEPMLVPNTAKTEALRDYLPRLQRHWDVSSSDGSVHLPQRPVPTVVLSVEWQSVDSVRVQWHYSYRTGDDDRRYGVDDPRGFRGVRDRVLEQRLVRDLDLSAEERHRLCGAGGRPLADQSLRDVAAIGLADLLPALEGRPTFTLSESGHRPSFREAVEAPVVTFEAAGPGNAERATDRPDWLDLEVVIGVEGHYVGLATLLEALTLGHQRIIMPGGVHVRVDRPEFAQLAQLVEAAAELVDQPRDGVRVHRGDLGLWDELAEVGIVDAQAQQWVEAARALKHLVTLPHVEPVGLKATLRSYQHQGFSWLAFLWQSGLGGILADDMGLGKTVQTLALVAHARAHGAAPFLVVAPTSVVSTWAHEAAAFTPGLTVHTVTESQARRGESVAEATQGADLVITTYTLYRLEAGDYAALPWGGLVLDEAQAVKNHHGKTHQAVRRLDVPFRLALTGTPMENRLMELWSLLSIVAPGLYPHPRRFAETVADPIEKEGDTQALERFRRRVRPFLLRRTKDLVASDLPPKQEQVLQVSLGPAHRRLYDTHLQRERQQVLGLVEDFDRHRVAIFRSLTRLRQLALDPALLDDVHDTVGSAKLDVLVDHLQEIVAEGHRALVFSQFTSFLSRARARIEREGITTVYLDGSTRDRGAVIDEFRRGEAGVFLISLKAGGVGLTLTEADYVFVLDPWWNPAVEAQAVDRAHRIGQRRPVMVYRLVSERTIEEKVMELKARKAALFAKVIDGEGGAGSPITADDVRALFD